MSDKSPTKLPVLEIFDTSFHSLSKNFTDLLKAGVPYIFGLILIFINNSIFLGENFYSGNYEVVHLNWFFWLANIIFFILSIVSAVSWHQIIIFNAGTEKRRIFNFSNIELRYIICLLVSLVILLIVGLIVGVFVFTLMLNLVDQTAIQTSRVLIYVSALISLSLPLYVFARICFILPSIAIRENKNMAWSIKLTKANGWRVVLIIMLIPLVLTQIQQYALFSFQSALVIQVFFGTISFFTTLYVSCLFSHCYLFLTQQTKKQTPE